MGIHTRIIPTTGRGLGRHVEHDDASRAFVAHAAATRPKSVKWTQAAPALDQGQLGSCTGNAMAQLLNTDWAQARLRTAGRSTGLLTEADAVKIYSLATRLDTIPGQYEPDDTGSSGLAVCKAAKKLDYLTGYNHAFGLTGLLLALQTQPVIMGIPWLAGMYDPNSKGVIQPTGEVAGGHELLVDEYDAANQLVGIFNSWSPEWGLNGHAYLRTTDLDRLLRAEGDVQVPVI